jgi:hypothetical protein
LGAETDLTAGDVRWLSPLPLWAGILAGPVAWAIDLCASYALVKWVCHTGRHGLLQMITVAALATVCGGAMSSWLALQHTRSVTSTESGHPRQRARFMALLGLTSCALFAVSIIAEAIPHWVLDACR